MSIRGVELGLRGLGKAISNRTILHDINLEIKPGEFIAIIGKSGCGKTTLLRLIAGLTEPTIGQVALDNSPLDGLNPAARVMFQDARLLPWKRVWENVALGLPGLNSEQALQALHQVGLADRAYDWPLGLSGGERQRLALARAIANTPSLLLLDEPFGALDALTRIEMQQLVEQLWRAQGFTAILVTHDVEEAIALADRVLLIQNQHIALNLPIHLPRSRQRGSAEFAAIKDQLLGAIFGAGYPLASRVVGA